MASKLASVMKAPREEAPGPITSDPHLEIVKALSQKLGRLPTRAEVEGIYRDAFYKQMGRPPQASSAYEFLKPWIGTESQGTDKPEHPLKTILDYIEEKIGPGYQGAEKPSVKAVAPDRRTIFKALTLELGRLPTRAEVDEIYKQSEKVQTKQSSPYESLKQVTGLREHPDDLLHRAADPFKIIRDTIEEMIQPRPQGPVTPPLPLTTTPRALEQTTPRVKTASKEAIQARPTKTSKKIAKRAVPTTTIPSVTSTPGTVFGKPGLPARPPVDTDKATVFGKPMLPPRAPVETATGIEPSTARTVTPGVATVPVKATPEDLFKQGQIEKENLFTEVMLPHLPTRDDVERRLSPVIARLNDSSPVRQHEMERIRNEIVQERMTVAGNNYIDQLRALVQPLQQMQGSFRARNLSYEQALIQHPELLDGLERVTQLETTGEIMKQMGINVPLISSQTVLERMFPELRKDYDALKAFKASQLHEYNRLSEAIANNTATPAQVKHHALIEANLDKAIGGMTPENKMQLSRLEVNERLQPKIEELIQRAASGKLSKQDGAVLALLFPIYLQNQKGEFRYPPRPSTAAGLVTQWRQMTTADNVVKTLLRSATQTAKAIDPKNLEASYTRYPSFVQLSNQFGQEPGGAASIGTLSGERIRSIAKNPYEFYLYAKRNGITPTSKDAMAYYTRGQDDWQDLVRQAEELGKRLTGIGLSSAIALGQNHNIPASVTLSRFAEIYGRDPTLAKIANSISNPFQTGGALAPVDVYGKAPQPELPKPSALSKGHPLIDPNYLTTIEKEAEEQTRAAPADPTIMLFSEPMDTMELPTDQPQ